MERSLGLSLDPAVGTPLYQQLFDRIAERIRTGAFPAGFRLPPSRRLAGELGTHRNTVVRAYTELEQGGFLSSTVGRGTFVRAQPIAVAPSAPAGPGPGTMPWSSLLSDRARAEAFSRFHRISRSVGRGELVNLARMHPDPELVPEELFRRCLEHVQRTLGARALGYAPPEGVPRLRERIALDLGRQGVPARAEDVVVTSGSQQAIDIVARTLVEPGDLVLAEDATYSGAVQIFAAAGARMLGVPSDGEGPEPGRLGNFGRAKALYLMPNHSNPTGTSIGARRRQELVEWSRATGTPIVEDDYAADLELDGAAAPPAMRALDGDVLYLSTFSKKLIPALRIGLLLCPPPLAPHLVPLAHAASLGPSGLLQHALAEFLERGYLAAHLNRIRASYRERRDALAEALRAHLPDAIGFDVPPRGTSLWLRLPDELDGDLVFEEARRRGVLVSPGSLHRADRSGRSPAGIRVLYCYEPVPRLVEGARRLGAAIDALAAHRHRPSPEPVGVV